MTDKYQRKTFKNADELNKFFWGTQHKIISINEVQHSELDVHFPENMGPDFGPQFKTNTWSELVVWFEFVELSYGRVSDY